MKHGSFEFQKTGGWFVPGRVNIRAYRLHVGVGDGKVRVQGRLGAALGSQEIQYEKMTLPSPKGQISLDIGQGILPGGLVGIFLTPNKDNELVWNFSLSGRARISHFPSPSRQGCALSFGQYTDLAASPSVISFPSRGPVYQYWFTKEGATQGFEFVADKMVVHENEYVLHDASTLSCMCLKMAPPTGKLADSCYECPCSASLDE